MNADRLLGLYHRMADAPDAVARLRRFVLDLAVRGQLVEQDPSDEPATKLLKRLEAEKHRMVRAGELRKPRKPRSVASGTMDLEVAFRIPASWCWCRLAAIGAIVGGGTPRASDARSFAAPGEGVAWLTPRDLGGCRSLYIGRGSRDLSPRGLDRSAATLMPAGTVLFSSRAPVGYVAIAANPVATNQGFKSVVPYDFDCSRYIALALQSLVSEIEATASGTTFKEVSGGRMAGVPFPLPPLAEQHRIVAKVDELMALCDRLEGARSAREGTRDRLTKASHDLLRDTNAGARKCRDHARFVVDALPALTDRSDQVEDLRRTILSLAVRGKLVEQDPSDEQASELLKRIEAEKARLVKGGEMRKRKVASRPGEPPFSLPATWHWARIGDVVGDRGQKVPDRPFTYIDVTAIDKKAGLVAGPRVLKPAEAPSRARKVARRGDVVYSCVRPYLLNVAIIEEDFEPAPIVSTAFEILNGCGLVLPRYTWIVLRSSFMIERVEESQRGQAYPAIKSTDFVVLPFPLPPLAEQHRIVARVDGLMALCDRLEAGLRVAEDTRGLLLDSLLHEVHASHETARMRDVSGVASAGA